MAKDFSQLPEELINIILERLSSIEDVVRVGAVCKSWNSLVFIWKKKRGTRPFAPWLMLTTYKYEDDSSFRTFFSYSTKTCFNLEFPHEYIEGRRFFGSTFGWLVTISLDLNIHLLNPLTRTQISLPPQPTFQHQYPTVTPKQRRCFVHKFALCSNPSLSPDHTCVVMAIYGVDNRLAFARPGDEAWTCIEAPHWYIQDVILFNGKFYIVDIDGLVMVCDDINTSHPKATELPFPRPTKKILGFYLIEMSGNLLLVERVIGRSRRGMVDHYTKAFEIRKFDFELRSWMEVSELGEHALFIGMNTSFAISTSEYPAFKSGCIYYAHDQFRDMGVYDYDNNIGEEPIYRGHDVLTIFSRPIFIMPSF